MYSEKLTHAKHSEKEMIVLAWTVKELGELNDIGRKLFGDITILTAKVKSLFGQLRIFPINYKLSDRLLLLSSRE